MSGYGKPPQPQYYQNTGSQPPTQPTNPNPNELTTIEIIVDFVQQRLTALGLTPIPYRELTKVRALFKRGPFQATSLLNDIDGNVDPVRRQTILDDIQYVNLGYGDARVRYCQLFLGILMPGNVAIQDWGCVICMVLITCHLILNTVKSDVPTFLNMANEMFQIDDVRQAIRSMGGWERFYERVYPLELAKRNQLRLQYGPQGSAMAQQMPTSSNQGPPMQFAVLPSVQPQPQPAQMQTSQQRNTQPFPSGGAQQALQIFQPTQTAPQQPLSYSYTWGQVPAEDISPQQPSGGATGGVQPHIPQPGKIQTSRQLNAQHLPSGGAQQALQPVQPTSTSPQRPLSYSYTWGQAPDEDISPE